MTSLDREFNPFEGKDSDAREGRYPAPELSDEDYTEHTAGQTANALQSTKLFEVVEVKTGIGQIHLLGRVKQDNERAFLDKVVVPILKVLEKYDGHICKQFLLKNGDLKYAWSVSFAAEDIRAVAHEVCNAIAAAVPKLQVMEAPLVGPSTPQGAGPRGGRKGASPIRG
jgi:hypothetical protein